MPVVTMSQGEVLDMLARGAVRLIATRLRWRTQFQNCASSGGK